MRPSIHQSVYCLPSAPASLTVYCLCYRYWYRCPYCYFNWLLLLFECFYHYVVLFLLILRSQNNTSTHGCGHEDAKAVEKQTVLIWFRAPIWIAIANQIPSGRSRQLQNKWSYHCCPADLPASISHSMYPCPPVTPKCVCLLVLIFNWHILLQFLCIQLRNLYDIIDLWSR